jgi:hypothetical protein
MPAIARESPMASAFSRLASNSDQTFVAPGFLRPIDAKAVAKELRLVEMGRSRAQDELPRTDETVRDGVEQTIIQKIEAEWTWQGDALIKTLRAYADRLVGFSVSGRIAELRLIAHDARSRFLNASVQADGELGSLKEAYIAARDELRRFEARHRLERPARNPKGRWVTFGFLTILIAAESVLNGTFFAQGDEFGLIGGIGTAVGISLVNVMCAFLLGLGPARFINYRGFVVWPLALFVTIAGIGALLGLHTFAAHYRDAVGSAPDGLALSRAVQTLLDEPWAVKTLSSWYLFALGVLFALGSIWKGYRFDDPYPFYGGVWRRAESARVEYSEEHQLLFDDLEEYKNSAVEAIKAGIATLPLFPQRAAQVRAQRIAQVDQFRAYEGSVETTANQLLQIYRDENRKHRKTVPPVHFAEKWKLPHSFLRSGQVLELTAEPTTSEPEIPSALAELQQESNALLAQYAELLLRNPHPTKME